MNKEHGTQNHNQTIDVFENYTKWFWEIKTFIFFISFIVTFEKRIINVSKNL